jgi:hypothetical protein
MKDGEVLSNSELEGVECLTDDCCLLFPGCPCKRVPTWPRFQFRRVGLPRPFHPKIGRPTLNIMTFVQSPFHMETIHV